MNRISNWLYAVSAMAILTYFCIEGYTLKTGLNGWYEVKQWILSFI